MPISVTQAMAEAHATPASTETILPTLELMHASFIEDDEPTPVRIVRNNVDLSFKLEDTAPYNEGETVLFRAIPFDIDWPRIGPIGAECKVRIDNVGREVSKYLALATTSNQPITVIIRGYLESDPDTVGAGPYKLYLRNIKRTPSMIEGSLIVAKANQVRVLKSVYDLVNFPSLAAI